MCFASLRVACIPSERDRAGRCDHAYTPSPCPRQLWQWLLLISPGNEPGSDTIALGILVMKRARTLNEVDTAVRLMT